MEEVNVFNNIKALAAARGITLDEVIKKINITASSYYQSQKRNSIASHTLIEIAKALDVHPSRLWDDLTKR